MYGASFVSPSVTPDAIVPRPAIELVRGMVIVLVIFMDALGKNFSIPMRANSRGVGKPPNPDSLGSGRCEIEGRTEYVLGNPAEEVPTVGFLVTIRRQHFPPVQLWRQWN